MEAAACAILFIGYVAAPQTVVPATPTEHTMGTPPLSSRRQILARTCLTLALIIFVAGSAKMVDYFLNLGWSNTTPESALGVLVYWPLLMVALMILTGVALWAIHRRHWIWGVVGASVVVIIVPVQLALSGATSIGQQLPVMGSQPPTIAPPYTGAALATIVAFFLAVDAVALYAGWRVARRIGRLIRS